MADAEAKRQEVVDFIWKGQGLPTSDSLTLVTNVENPISSMRLPNLAGVDELIVSMGRIESHVFRFRPVASNGRLALFHAGHSDGLGDSGGDIAIQGLLSAGYEVLGFLMPGYGPNTKLPTPDDGSTPHDSFAAEETATFTPLIYFVEPVAIALNYVTNRHTYDDVQMIGISGGGWTTTLYAAIDPRVRVSYPVAGTLPLYLRTTTCDKPEMGDWEQSQSGLYAIVDYSELYVLGAYGTGRSQIQVMNEYDACCFWGRRHRVYEQQVRTTVKKLGGGSFRVLLDRSIVGEHGISPWVVEQILDHAESQEH